MNLERERWLLTEKGQKEATRISENLAGAGALLKAVSALIRLYSAITYNRTPYQVPMIR